MEKQPQSEQMRNKHLHGRRRKLKKFNRHDKNYWETTVYFEEAIFEVPMYCDAQAALKTLQLKIITLPGHSIVEDNQRSGQLERLGTKISNLEKANSTKAELKL